MTRLLDLPVDILVLILPYLDAVSLLRFTATCSALHSPAFAYDAAYWSSRVRSDFRVPNQPVVENDGRRWQKLYRRLLRESRIYTWGNDERGCLGHASEAVSTPLRWLRRDAAPAAPPPAVPRRRHVSWPGQMQFAPVLGVVADLQCGGWSTTLLTAKGALYSVGVLDGTQAQQPAIAATPTPLPYPIGFPHPRTRYDASTAVRQFSAGRTHVLAVADSGRVWSWWHCEHAALHVKLLHHDMREDGRTRGMGAVRKVVAGWSKSAVLIDGVGIVMWEPLKLLSTDIGLSDAVLVLESQLVRNTGHSNVLHASNGPKTNGDTANLATTVGEVLNFVILEEVVLFNTSLGKVFAIRIVWDRRVHVIARDPVELNLSTSRVNDHEAPGADSTFATDIQGSYHSYAIFLRSGAVLTGKQDTLLSMLAAHESTSNNTSSSRPSLFTRIPALQHRNVISIAFGDHHFHALHASGHITSYGTEPQACGALGLGGRGSPEGRLRGIRYSGRGGDGGLIPHAYTTGRRVWFEKEKKYWIQFLTSGGVDPQEAAQRMRMAIGSPGVAAQGELSEWIEQEGNDWARKVGIADSDATEDGLGAYFVLSVAAAGWHSGALVLVNEELAARVSAACEVSVAEQQTTPAASAESQQEETPALSSGPPSLLGAGLSWLFGTAADYARYFLGYPPYNAVAHDRGASNGGRVSDPIDLDSYAYGASSKSGRSYVWAKDHFPRLKLSDGTEMPGTVEFDEWRRPRPDWKLDWLEDGETEAA